MIPAPRPYQLDAIQFAEPKPAAMIAGGMGIGKSCITAHLLLAWQAYRTLIICPAGVRDVWRRELPKHTDGNIRPVILDRGAVAMRTTKAADILGNYPAPLAFVINIEAAWREPFASWVLSQHWDAVVADEAHHLKNEGTECGTFAARLNAVSSHRLGLSGTVLAHSPLDAWGQYRFLDPSIFGLDYRAYVARYAAPRQMRARKRYRLSYQGVTEMIGRIFGQDSPLLDDWQQPMDVSAWWPGLRHAKEFAAKIAPITWSCKTEDVIDLPPLITDYRQVDMGPEAERLYQSLERRAAADLYDSTVRADSHLGMLTRLQQITSGIIPTPDGSLHVIDNAKRRMLYDLLAEAGEQTIVFTRYTADLDAVRAVAESLGLRYGEVSGRRKDAMDNMAVLRPDIDVAGVMPKSGGEGCDMSAAKIGVFYSLAQSLAEYDQSVRRLHRPGSTGTRIYSLVCGGTIDADIHAAIADRRNVVQHVMNRLHERNERCPILRPA